MTTQSNAMPESFDSQGIAPGAMSATRPMYWSVRRELWENRSIYVAPMAVAALYLLGYLISVIVNSPSGAKHFAQHSMRHLWMPHSMSELATLGPADQLISLAMPYSHAA